MPLYPFELDENGRVCAEFYQSMSPDLRHDMIRSWNWDFCPNFLHWVVAQDDCELATAGLIFWLSGPDHYEMYNETLWPRASDEHFFTVREVFEKARKDLYKNRSIEYKVPKDFLNDYETNLFESENEEYWRLPEPLKNDIEGVQVPEKIYYNTYKNMKNVPEHLAPKLEQMAGYLFEFEEEEDIDVEGRA